MNELFDFKNLICDKIYFLLLQNINDICLNKFLAGDFKSTYCLLCYNFTYFNFLNFLYLQITLIHNSN